jgi:Domain of unknown function (DUF1707)
MNQIDTASGAPVRASDAERDQAAEVLRAAFAEGRLTRAELDERIAGAYAAKTRADLRGLTSDLPGALSPLSAGLPIADPDPGYGTGMHLDWCLLLCLLFAFPPAGIAYWILTARRRPRPSAPGLLPPDGGRGGAGDDVPGAGADDRQPAAGTG